MKRLAQSEYEKLIEEYIALMKMHFGERLRSICLFGSVARGNAAANSDIDILVVADDLPEEIGLRIKETSYIHQKLKTGEGYSSLRALGKSGLISDLYFTPNEIEKHPPILLDIAEDGIILYDEV
ncbi:MAG: nucleotidyltransferase domain-containing protein, partial [Methanocellales archaeon]